MLAVIAGSEAGTGAAGIAATGAGPAVMAEAAAAWNNTVAGGGDGEGCCAGGGTKVANSSTRRSLLSTNRTTAPSLMVHGAAIGTVAGSFLARGCGFSPEQPQSHGSFSLSGNPHGFDGMLPQPDFESNGFDLGFDSHLQGVAGASIFLGSSTSHFSPFGKAPGSQW
jgi:hypothetical protein